jgi:hypothetical protein
MKQGRQSDATAIMGSRFGISRSDESDADFLV